MAYAVLSSLPPIYGLYTSTIAGYVYTLFGTSGQLTLGPVALVSGRIRGPAFYACFFPPRSLLR